MFARTWIALVYLLTVAAVRAEPPVAELLKLHAQDAAAYRMFHDAEQEQAAEFTAKPIFNWTNLVGEHTQYGHLFVWMHQGRPAAIGTIFSTRTSDSRKRMLVHEFHTLSLTQLFPVTPADSAYQWKPQRGIAVTALASAPSVAATSNQRLTQMRGLARTFAASSRSKSGKTWELKLLPTPLITYEPTGGEVLCGALSAMISSAGTDPEVLLLIEARHPAPNDKTWTWQGAALRFSDHDLKVTRNDKPLWSSLDDETYRAEIKNSYTLIETADKTYTCYRARTIDELPDAVP